MIDIAERPSQLTFGTAVRAGPPRVKISVRDLNLWYDNGRKHALKDVSLDVFDNEVTALIGPSGCGKSSFLKSLNRINESLPGVRATGTITLDGRNIMAEEDVCLHRARFGWVAQQPNPFPRSIYENVAYAARLHGIVAGRVDTDDFVEACLRRVALWDEVKDRLGESGRALSGGQQQRLCIARALSTQSEVILMDEPCSALGPGATASVEALIEQLRVDHTVIIVTHNLQQAARIAQRVAYFHLGALLEAGEVRDVMVNPQTQQCRAYVSGAFG